MMHNLLIGLISIFVTFVCILNTHTHRDTETNNLYLLYISASIIPVNLKGSSPKYVFNNSTVQQLLFWYVYMYVKKPKDQGF